MSQTIRQIQQANIDRIRNRDREKLMRTFGAKFDPGKIQWDGGVSFRKLEEVTKKHVTMAANDTALEYLIQYGIQDMLFNVYMEKRIVYEDLVVPVTSKTEFEKYPSLSRAAYPEKVLKGEPIAHSSLFGAEVKVYNEKYGVILALAKELIRRDQTGKVMMVVQGWATAARAFEERLVMTAIEGSTFSTTLAGGGANRPNAFAALDKNTLKAAFVALAGMKNEFGQDIAVEGNILLHGAANVLNAAEILMPNQITPNILQGMCKPVFSAHLGSSAAYLLQSKTAVVFQVEEPLQIVQEAINSGADFEQDERRWKLEETCAAATLDSRFIYKIN